MKGLQSLTTEAYKTRGGKFNFRVTAKINLKKNPICLICNPQGYSNKKECEEVARGWTYKGMTPDFVWLKKYYRLS